MNWGSLVGIKYKDGVMIGGSTLISRGSTLMYHMARRFVNVGDDVVLAASGDVADFQEVAGVFQLFQEESELSGIEGKKSAAEYHNLLSRWCYRSRSKMEPVRNVFVVAGLNADGSPFLGTVDVFGTAFTENVVATSMAQYYAIPILRKEWREDLTEDEAREILIKGLKVCQAREKGVSSEFQLAKVTKQGIEYSQPFQVLANWEVGEFYQQTMSKGFAY